MTATGTVAIPIPKTRGRLSLKSRPHQPFERTGLTERRADN
jgi:hypothetical protein